MNKMRTKLLICTLFIASWVTCLYASDVLEIKERAVVYFFPTKAEVEIIISNNEDYGAVLDDYFYYQNNMVDYLKQHSIKLYSSSHSVIKAFYEGGKYIEFNRKKDISKIGYILVDGSKKPKILFGVYTGIDLMFELQPFFNIQQ
jgi:hypothetical protein